jgi:hypothetical protein
VEEALRISLAEVKRHAAEMIALNEMNDLLSSCETREEAYAIIAESAEVLFSPYAGGLAVKDGAGSDLHRVAAWSGTGDLSPHFSLHDCWALRRGQLHEVTPSRERIDCRHFATRPPPTYLCLPLNVRGMTYGMLHVNAAQTLTEAQLQALRTLSIAVGESIKLALSNLELHEVLRGALVDRGP